MQHIIFLFGLLMLLTPAAHAQKPAGYPRTLFVTFANAPVYDSASYLSNVAGSLRTGDSITALASLGKFFRISFNGREGYVLGANVAAKKPAATHGAAKKSTADRAGTAAGARPSEPDGTGVLVRMRVEVHESSPPANTSGQDVPADSARATGSAGTSAQSQQCSGVTKSGNRCSRMTFDPSGYCWQHKKSSTP
jgi:hypothetical protein